MTSRLPALRQWEVLIAMNGQFKNVTYEGHEISIENGILTIMRGHESRDESPPRAQMVVMIPPGAWGPVSEIFIEPLGNQVSLVTR